MPHEPPASPAAGAGRAWKPAGMAELFGIDLRSLAAFRIGLGLLLLWDLYGRAKTLRMHYTGEGALPRELAAVAGHDSPLFHVFLWSDRFAVQAALFGVFALLALALLVGYRTRLASVLVFVFLESLVRRNWYACHTGDTWLAALSFWAMFLPLGAHFSVDRLRGRAAPRSLGKNRPPAESQQDASWQGAATTRVGGGTLGGAATPPRRVLLSSQAAGDSCSGSQAVGRVLSVATACVLLQITVFYLSAGYLKSRYDVWLRGDAMWVFTHTLEYTRPFGQWLGQFPALCSAVTYATLVQEGLAPLLFFFPFGSRWIRSLLFLAYVAFHLTIQATIHIGIFQFTCIVALMLFLPSAAWELAGRAVPGGWRARWSSVRDAVRVRFERSPTIAAGGAWKRPASLAVQAALVPVFLLVLVSNLNTAADTDPYKKGDELVPLPAWIDGYGRQVSLIQNWNMFTDIDGLFLGWFQVVGRQEDGEVVDVLARGPFEGLARPEHYASYFPNHNSRRYWREVTREAFAFLRPPLCAYLAREWEREGRVPLENLAIFHIGRVPSRAPEADEVRRIAVWTRPLPADAAPELRQRRVESRDAWGRFLDGLPKSVP